MINITENANIRELESRLVLTAYRNPKTLYKLRPLQEVGTWYNTSAKTVLNKLMQNKPIMADELSTLGELELMQQHIEGAIDEILDHDYAVRIDRWIENVRTARELGDKVTVEKMIDSKPLKYDSKNYSLIADGIDDLTQYIAQAKSLNSSVVRHPFLEVRDVLGDIGPGLHVVAGLPGSMKSGYTEQIELSISDFHKCGVFSLEMPKRQKLARYLQHMEGPTVGPKAINSGIADSVLLQSAAAELRKKKIYIDDRPENIVQLINAMEVLEMEEAPDYYSVDFLQVLNPLPGETDYQSVKSNIKQLYTFAKRYSKPVFVLSQLNRESDKPEFSFYNKKSSSEPKTPKMRDLEGAGTIEQVAQNITFIQQVEDTFKRRLYVVKNRDGESPYDFEEVDIVPTHMNFKFSLNSKYK